MRSYRVSGLHDERAAEAIRQALLAHYGGGAAVEVYQSGGESRNDRSADPQIIRFLIEGTGHPVISVGG